ncbi:hypothetical protein B0H14DRAFT_3461126 [Mycena olivaceomarginata]|nr:hypothetical protein B0H14DRAFT_3461126 [Mycena olivaceomarginata]
MARAKAGDSTKTSGRKKRGADASTEATTSMPNPATAGRDNSGQHSWRLPAADLIDHDPTGIKAALGETHLPTTDADWFPYPSKLFFLLDFIDNLPRLRLSSALLRIFIFVLKEAKCRDTVPSYDRFREFQKELRAQSGIPTSPQLPRTPKCLLREPHDLQNILEW